MYKNICLTTGSIANALLRLFMPLLYANVLQQFYNVVNSLVVSHYLGNDAFAALGVAESLLNLFTFIIIGACTGISVLTAQFYGEGDLPRLQQHLYTCVVLIGGGIVLMIAAGQFFLPQLLEFINTPKELCGEAAAYLRVSLLGMLCTFAYHYLACALRAVGRPKTALYFLLASLGYNLIVSWLLIGVFNWGITGAALAAASAQLAAALLCMLYIRRKVPVLRIHLRAAQINRSLLGLAGGYAVAAALQQSSLYLGKLLIQSFINDLGTAAVTAFTAASRVENALLAFAASGCEAIAIFVPQNRGANLNKRAKQGFLYGLMFQVLTGALFSLLLQWESRAMIQPFLSAQEIKSLLAGTSYLNTVGYFYILAFISYSFVGWYRGSGKISITFWGTTLQLFVRVTGTYLLVDRLALDAVAWSTGLGWTAVVLFQIALFMRDGRQSVDGAKTLNQV